MPFAVIEGFSSAVSFHSMRSSQLASDLLITDKAK